VLKTRGQIARGKLVSEVTQDEKDVAAGFMRERGKDDFNIGERDLGHPTG